jgi:hypothetical protein
MLLSRHIFLAAALVGLTLAGSVHAQDTLLQQLSRSDSSWLRFNLVNGRVSLRCARMGGLETSNNGKDRKETINIQDDNSQSKLNYELTTKEERLTLTATATVDKMLIRREPLGKAAFTPIEFTQAPGEKITLTLGAGAEKRTFQSPDIWRLMIAQPKVCKEQLFPLLDMVHSGWKFSEIATGVEEKLLQSAGKDVAPDHKRWDKLIELLGDERFAKREAADRALRAEGLAAVGYLRQLDFGKLDAEQQFRVGKILDAFTGINGDDSTDEIATSLAADPSVWLDLLSRPEPATRKATAAQLAILLGEPIDVDPAADPDSQKEKREQLKARIESK